MFILIPLSDPFDFFCCCCTGELHYEVTRLLVVKSPPNGMDRIASRKLKNMETYKQKMLTVLGIYYL